MCPLPLRIFPSYRLGREVNAFHVEIHDDIEQLRGVRGMRARFTSEPALFTRMSTSPTAPRAAYQFVNSSLCAQVGADELSIRSGRTNFGDSRECTILMEVIVQDQPRNACFGERNRRRCADAARSAGDDSRLSLKIRDQWVLLSM